MTVKGVYFKIFILLGVGFLGNSCVRNTTTFSYTETYQGYSTRGFSARALTKIDYFAVIAGKDGSISFQLISDGELSQKRNIVIAGTEDFRDVHCRSTQACLFMNSGKRGIIYLLTRDGTANIVLDADSVFLDGISFWDNLNGLVYGDPVKGKFFLARTSDGGESWEILNNEKLPDAIENEAGFAASGTGIQTVGDSTVYFATGIGKKARIFYSSNRGDTWTVKNTPVKSGDESYGIYSMYFWNETSGMVIGGSFLDTNYSKKICYTTKNRGNSWSNRSKTLLGYCSCVQGNESGDVIVATGRMGTFYTLNQGKSWSLLTPEPYYTCYMMEDHILLSGRNGKLAIYHYEYMSVLN